jgi:hypothetical protein
MLKRDRKNVLKNVVLKTGKRFPDFGEKVSQERAIKFSPDPYQNYICPNPFNR